MSRAPLKTCGCGTKHSDAAWLGLELVGLQDDGDGGWLILRNCVCGSTLSVTLEDDVHARWRASSSSARLRPVDA